MLGYFRCLLSYVILLFSTNTFADSLMSSETWKKEYHFNRIENPDNALSMLNQLYTSLPPSTERIFVATRIHGFVTRRDESYYFPTSHHPSNPYEGIESLVLLSMDLEDKGDYHLASEHIQKAQQQANPLNDLDLNSLLSIKQCRSNLALGNHYLAEFYCQSAIKHLKQKPNHYIDVKWPYRLLALSYQGMSDFSSALKTNEKALSLSKSYELNDTIYHNISALMLQMGQLDEAEKYAKKALHIREKRNISQKTAQSHILLAQIYLAASKYKQARRDANFAIHLLDNDSRHAKTLSQAYLTLAAVLKKQHYEDEAIEYLLLALKQLDCKSNSGFLINTYQLLSRAYLKHENPNKALYYAEIAIEKSQQSKNQQALANSYLIQAEIDEFNGDFKAALMMRKKYEHLIDTITQKNNENNHITVELRRLMVEKEREKKESLQQLSDMNTQKEGRIFVYFAVFIALFMLGMKMYAHKKTTSNTSPSTIIK